MKPILSSVILALLSGVATHSAAAAEMTAAETASLPTQWTISYAGKPLMVYASDPRKFKPHVQALYTVAGYGVLRDSPFDHLHHHALMYGIKVNGINFWEETPGCGVEKVVETTSPAVNLAAGNLPVAKLSQTLHWLAPEDAFQPNTNAHPLLIEHRTVAVWVQGNETALHWQSRFEVGSKTNTVTLTGANYHGLGMRFLQELDGIGVHVTPEGNPDLGNSRQDVTRHAWEAVTFDAPGKPATIALFGAPRNPREDAVYFAMKTPFCYLSATQGLDKEALVYHQGDQFELNYLVTLYPEVQSAEKLAERARVWREKGQ